jgi:hypothetical protein
LKNSGEKYSKMWKAFRMCKNRVKGLTWNELHGDLKKLDCMSKQLQIELMGKSLLHLEGDLPLRCW